MSDDGPGGSYHEGGWLAGEIRLLLARRRVLQAVARGNLETLQRELPTLDLSRFDAAVCGDLGRLATLEAALDPALRSAWRLLERLARQIRRERTELVNEAMLGWRDIWLGTMLPVHRVAPTPLPQRLIRSARSLLGGGSSDPLAILNTLIEGALRDQGGLNGSISPQHLRNWGRLQHYSFQVMPSGPGERSGERCTVEHFRAISQSIPKTDQNTPRSISGIYELFWRFCDCCAGTSHASTANPDASSPGRQSARRGSDEIEAEPAHREEAEAVSAVAHEAVDERLAAILAAVAALTPPRRQAVTIHLWARKAKLDGVYGGLLPAPLVAAYPWLLREPLAEMDDEAFAVRLGLPPKEFAQERIAAAAWLKATVAQILGRRRGAPTQS